MLTLQATIEDKGNEAGEISLSFTPTHAGQHRVYVTFRRRNLQGSPFTLEVVDQHIYRRDYGKVGDQPASRFGSKGSDNGQFNLPISVACNSRGDHCR